MPASTGAFAGRRVLVTGGLGFIGSNLVHALAEVGAAVLVLDSLDPRSGGQVGNVTALAGVQVVPADVCQFESVLAHMPGVEYLFHCAAHSSHPYSMRDPQRDIEVNCVGTINVLEGLRRFCPGARMVYVGTSTQVGPMLVNPIDEQHALAPMDIYSANKAAAEHYCRIYAGAYKLGVNVVRLPNVFGPRANIHNPDFGFINYFVGRALQNEALTMYGNGAQLRSVLYVADAVSALLAAALAPATGQVWFAANAQSISVRALAERIVAVFGSGRVEPVEWPAARERIDVGDVVIDSSKMRSELGWQPQFALDAGLAATAAFFRQP